MQTIEIDCAPGAPRPDSVLADVLAGTDIPVRDAVSKVFGNWTFDYSDIPADVWQKNNDVIRERLTAAYHAGRVRYASW